MRVEEGTAKKEWPCKHNGCRKSITKGQSYYLWHLNGSALRQHQDHGQPAQPAPKKATAKNNTQKVTAKTTKEASREEGHNQEEGR